MSPGTVTVATGAVVMAGRWSQGKGIELNIAVALVTLGFILSILADANPKFASRLGLLIFVGALFTYVPFIVGKQAFYKKNGAGNISVPASQGLGR